MRGRTRLDAGRGGRARRATWTSGSRAGATIDRFWGDARFDGRRPARTGLVTLFTNLTWDSAVIGQELAFPRIQDWVAAAVEAFADRPDDELVVRIHPAEVKLPGKQTREPMLVPSSRRFRSCRPTCAVIDPTDPTSSYPLMAASDVGLVFTSTTGLELALRACRWWPVAPTIGARASRSTWPPRRSSRASPTPWPTLRPPPDLDLARRYAYLFFFGPRSARASRSTSKVSSA